MRLGGELDGAEQAVQSPEILVFQPRGARIFVAGDGERMLGFGGIGGVAIAVSQRFRHIEFARRESVLAVTHERAVKPYVDRGGGTVEGEADRAVVFQRARKLRVERESTAVGAILVVFRNIWRLRILVTVPRILDVDVLVLEIAGPSASGRPPRSRRNRHPRNRRPRTERFPRPRCALVRYEPSIRRRGSASARSSRR